MDGVSKGAVEEFPTEAALSELDDKNDTEPFLGVEVEIRATDRDKRGKGWAGIIHEDGFKRLPMDLYPTIDPEIVASAKIVRADVLVEYTPTKDGTQKPVRFHLLVVHEVLS
ncbi:MAG: hypothetical protein Q7S99_09165 [Parvibaculum sp.]|nr:hypothetical protein [Parvibaculum sp.]